MAIEEFNENINKRGVKKEFIFGGIAVIILLLAVLVFVFMRPIDTLKNDQDPFLDLKGRIYLTLAPAGDNAVDLYSYDIETNHMETVFRFSEFGDIFVGYTSKFSPKDNKIAYFSAPIDRNSVGTLPYSIFLGLFVSDFNTDEWKMIEKSSVAFKRLPEWSPDGKRIAFTGKEPNTGDFKVLNDWNVYVTDLEGNVERIDFGSYPHWSPDGTKLLFMRNKGLYVYDFKKGKSTIEIPIDEITLSINEKIDVSADGSLLALSGRGFADLLVYRIISWEPFKVEVIREIQNRDAVAFWPVFSPDNRYLVFQEADWDDNALSNPRLVVYDLRTFERKTLIDLREYNINSLFVTDWQIRE